MIKIYESDTTEKIAGYVVSEWADGNPSSENRIGRFVAYENNSNKIILATSDSYVAGVSEDYNGSHTMVKVNPIGISVVEDNGTLVEGDICIPSNDGKAIKSSNNIGYKVLERVDDTHIHVFVTPSSGSDYMVNGNLDSKVDKEYGKGLSTNDLTDALKNNYDDAYTHSQSAHAPSNAQANVIEIINVNGVSLITNSKAVNISVPTKVSQLTNDSGFVTTDNNTTYTLSKEGSSIILTGSDGSTTSVLTSDIMCGEATTSKSGLMSANDKRKLDTISEGATNIVIKVWQDGD